MLNKPIIVLAWPGRSVPPGLARVAHRIIELDVDLDTQEGQRQAGDRIKQAMDELASE